MTQHCDPCHEVSRRLHLKPEIAGESQLSATFGTVGEILGKSNCVSCADLAIELRRREGEEDWAPLPEHLLVGLVVHNHESYDALPNQPLYVIAEDPQAHYEIRYLVNLYPLERLGAPQDDWGILFDRYHFDLERVKKWLRCCDESHGAQCTTSLVDSLPKTSFPRRILLVDVQERCLVYGDLSERYIGLSYVWGKANTLRSTTAILPELLKAGSLDFNGKSLRIPETVRDFHRLAVRLEIRYAWVDSLCIVQDGKDMKKQLNGMAAIFSSTYLTVVGEGVDANWGLLGVGLGSEPRDEAYPMFRLPAITSVLKENTVPKNRASVWETRAWTFQEGLFSRRLLIFDSAGMLTWKCPRLFWSEQYARPSEDLDWAEESTAQMHSDWRYMGFSTLTPGWPDMRRWCQLAEEYYTREVSFSSDTTTAIAGLMSVMSKVVPGGFFYGLPELFFDVFILWDVTGNSERIGCADIPSWSFLGWKGGFLDTFWWKFSLYHTFIDHPDPGFGCDCEVGSSRWFKRRRDTAEQISISNDIRKYQSCNNDEVPEGWSKRIGPDGTAYFTHESIENMPFRFSIPLADRSVGDEGLETEFSQHLYFKTQRSWLTIGTAILQDTDEEPARDVGSFLHDDAGNWAGAVRIHTSGTVIGSEIDEQSPDQKVEGKRVELILIATGKVSNNAFPKETPVMGGEGWNIPEWDCEDRPKQDEIYQFYFVLSIEWVEGIAYRTGLGRVEKQAWDKLAPDEIDVKLG